MTATGPRELYVWYRVTDAQAEAARAAVLAMQAALRSEWPGLSAALLTRDEAASAQTWMERYCRPGVAAGVDARLQAGIESHAASRLAFIDGNRHCEAFVTVPL